MKRVHATLGIPIDCMVQQAFIPMLSRMVVGTPPAQLRDRILALTLTDQASLVLSSLLAFGLSTSLFAEAGPGGILAFWGTLWALLR